MKLLVSRLVSRGTKLQIGIREGDFENIRSSGGGQTEM